MGSLGRSHRRWSVTAVVLFGMGVGLLAGEDRTTEADAASQQQFRSYVPALVRSEGSAPQATATPGPGNAAEITLHPVLDTARAVSRRVTYADGGTLTTTGADGARYTLTLPAHSLLVDTTVTMTPIGALPGLPAGASLAAGVQIEPDGMTLGVSASLEIVPANPVPAAEQIAFSYAADGEEAHAYPLAPDGGLRFSLDHFSGWSIARGSDAAQLAFMESRVSRVSAQVSQQFAAAVRSGGSIEAVATSSYATLVRPAMDTAEALANAGGIDSVQPGIDAFLSWARTVQLLAPPGTMDAEQTALWQQMQRIYLRVLENMRNRCNEQHDLSMVTRMVGMSRALALIGVESNSGFEYARKCAMFRLDFITSVHLTYDVWAYDVESLDVPVELLGLNPGAFPVTKPLRLLSFVAKSGNCVADTSAIHPTDPLVINSAELVGEWRRDQATKRDKWVDTDVEVTLEMGDLEGTVVFQCPGGQTYSFALPPGSAKGMWNSFHVSDSAGPGGFLIKGWQMLRGGLYARKTYTQTSAAGSEQTTLELWHVPED